MAGRQMSTLLMQSRAPLLRPMGWCIWELSHVQMGVQSPYVMLKRTALEDRAVAGLLAHFHSHLHSLRARGGAGSADSRMLLHFDETPEAEEAQVQAYEQFRG